VISSESYKSEGKKSLSILTKKEDFDLYILLEIRNDLGKRAHLDELLDMALALQVIHSCDMAHGDIKPENFLVSVFEEGKSRFKLGDLDTCRKMEGVKLDIHQGTYEYMAPEILRKEELVGKTAAQKADIFALGLTLWEARKGGDLRRKFNDGNSDTAFNMNPHKNIEEPPVDNKVDHIIWQMLSDDPVQRPSIDEVVSVFSQALEKEPISKEVLISREKDYLESMDEFQLERL
jgi:serine/threonine protein kinase